MCVRACKCVCSTVHAWVRSHFCEHVPAPRIAMPYQLGDISTIINTHTYTKAYEIFNLMITKLCIRNK